MAQSQQTFDFPILPEKELLEELNQIMPPSSSITMSDLRDPTPAKWQQFYIDILCYVFGVKVEQLTMLSFQESSMLPHPDIQNNFMLYLRLSRAMSHFLYTCRYTDFKLPDITSPNRQRLEKILSAIVNFCRHREEMHPVSQELLRAEQEARLQCEDVRRGIDEARVWINEKAKARADKHALVVEKKKEAEMTRKALDELERTRTELDNSVHQQKLKISELQKAVGEEKLRKTTLQEEVDELNKNIVPSPQKLQQEIQEQKNKMVVIQEETEEMQAHIEETNRIATQAMETNEALTKVHQTLKTTEDEIARHNELRPKLSALRDAIAARKEEYNHQGSKLQQLERKEAARVDKCAKIELAHAQKVKHYDGSELSRERGLLTDRLAGSDGQLDAVSEPLHKIMRQIDEDDKLYLERKRILEEKSTRVMDSLRRYNQKEMARFQE